MTNPHNGDIMNGEQLSSMQKSHLKNMYLILTDADLAGTRSIVRTNITAKLGIIDGNFNSLIAGKFFT